MFSLWPVILLIWLLILLLAFEIVSPSSNSESTEVIPSSNVIKVNVSLGEETLWLRQVSLARRTFTLELFDLHQTWLDPLPANVSNASSFASNETDKIIVPLPIDLANAHHLLRPSTCFVNSPHYGQKSLAIIGAPQSTILTLEPIEGRFSLTTPHLVVELACPEGMSHDWTYPHSTYRCRIELGSCGGGGGGGSIKNVIYEWDHDRMDGGKVKLAISDDEDNAVSDWYSLVGNSMVRTFHEFQEDSNGKSVSILVAEVRFRSSGAAYRHFLLLYLPSAAISTLSWTVLWLHPIEARVDRLTLLGLSLIGICLVLSQKVVTISENIQDQDHQAPPSGSGGVHLNLAEHWRIWTVIFTFALVAEQCLVAVFVVSNKMSSSKSKNNSNKNSSVLCHHRIRPNSDRIVPDLYSLHTLVPPPTTAAVVRHNSVPAAVTASVEDPSEVNKGVGHSNSDAAKHLNNIDLVARFMFPLCYGLFVFIFWAYTLDKEEEGEGEQLGHHNHAWVHHNSHRT